MKVVSKEKNELNNKSVFVCVLSCESFVKCIEYTSASPKDKEGVGMYYIVSPYIAYESLIL